ncbi:phosphoribosyltransferase domain-containing protein [Streptomyces sp. NPDC005955]|uniref:phosphoribosyltransferase n=1 Tax=Streptomyces sp. NPDC005955 TaxID=3364738 RepID=UPI0036753835
MDDVVWTGTWVADRLGIELVGAAPDGGAPDVPDGPEATADGARTGRAERTDRTGRTGAGAGQSMQDGRGSGRGAPVTLHPGTTADTPATGDTGAPPDGLDGGPALRDLLGLALRRNPKRAHLLVSNVLGKHVPQSPAIVHRYGYDLGRRVRDLLGEDLARRAVVLGYAETATGLGHCVADGIGVAPYLHSTRRPVPGVAEAAGFEEAHSHATSHLLLPADPDLLTGDGPLVLVDDEFSTGNTVLNTVRALHARYPRQRYVIVALVDMRSPGDRGRLDAFAGEIGARVDLVAAASGTVRLPDGVLEKGRALVAQYETAPGTGHPGTERHRHPDPAEAAVPPASVARAELRWPAGVPDGGRHGFTPEHRARLEAALPGLAEDLATHLPRGNGAPTANGDPVDRPRVLVLGFEELMYAPLRLATALEELGFADVRYSTTTRSPVLPVDDPGYAIRSSLVFPAHDDPGDGPGDRYAYNVAGAGFDAVVLVVDSVADTPALHAPEGLLALLTRHTSRVVLAVVPSCVPHSAAPTSERPSLLPEPLRGPAFSSYAPEDVGWLLQDLSSVTLEAPTEEREEAIQQGGAHYAESLPVEYQPSPQYQQLFHSALDVSARRIAQAVGTVTDLVLAERSPRPVLVSLARAGTPVGILMRRWALHRYGIDLPHYSVSIVRGRGIDANALRWLATHHDPTDVVFVDGWTGKGAITRELAQALKEFQEATGVHGFHPEIAVLADPGACVRTYGTREDFLIPSACLNSTVSGLVSRTVLRADLVGPDDYHGAKYYRELAGADVSHDFLHQIATHFPEVVDTVDVQVKEMLTADRAPTWEGWAAVERISEEYGIHDVNLVKPGVGETTRVLLRRVPWKVLARQGAGADLEHVRLLAEQRGVPVEEVHDLPYSCVGLIHPHYTRGATGSDGKAVTSL